MHVAYNNKKENVVLISATTAKKTGVSATAKFQVCPELPDLIALQFVCLIFSKGGGGVSGSDCS